MKKNSPEYKELLTDVYNTIVYRCEVLGFKSTNQKVLCWLCHLPWQEHAKHGDHCRMLWDVIRDINEDPDFEKIIIAREYEYRVATKEEVMEYCDKLYQRAVKILQRRGTILANAKLNDQMTMDTFKFHNSYIEKGDKI